ncbi:MAG: L-alanine-DL-glutamate epimerase-like enolase superfamily enzyme [Sulfurimonas sp.]|uniref:dipeptide epimerase n=1 Tax=Sulfurimonas sp. TaxID=2022749 RepID=UPI0039E5E407
MKIKSIETQLKTIPLKTPFITALRRVENVEFVRVHVACDNGFEAIGEAPATKAITGEGLEDILSSIESVKLSLIGTSPLEALEILHKSSIGSSAKAALDMAFVWLFAREKNQTLFQYFGEENICTLQTDITVSLKDYNSMIEDSIAYFEKGLHILKVKLGSDIAHAVKVTKEIAHKLPEAKLIIDANQAWSLEDSLAYIEAVRTVNIELIEQPVIAKDIESLKIITQKSHIPILADETVFTLQDAKKVIESQSADMINIKLMKCGGLSKAVEVLEYARVMNVKCMLGSMLEGPYSINAALHLAMAYRDVIAYIDLDSPLLYKEASDDLEFDFNASEIRYKG